MSILPRRPPPNAFRENLEGGAGTATGVCLLSTDPGKPGGKTGKVKELEAMEGYQTMELAPSKFVTTVKSPNGKRKARIVICGNLVTKLTRMATRSKRLQCRQRTCTLEELTQQPFDAWSERPP